MLTSSICYYIDVHIFVKGTVTVVGAGVDNVVRIADRNNKQVILENCALFSNSVSELKKYK